MEAASERGRLRGFWQLVVAAIVGVMGEIMVDLGMKR